MNTFIPCPHCGKRPIREFAYGEIPNVPEEITDPDEIAYERGFIYTNPMGVQKEAWFHVYGCRRWIVIRRDTRNDDIIEVMT